MTDRELLEAAARAAGIDHKGAMHPKFGLYTLAGPFWNPLTDDGDALRLAVKLHFTVRCYMGNTCVQATVPGGPSVMVDETNHMDPFSAIRRAIVRAAASLSPALSGVKEE